MLDSWPRRHTNSPTRAVPARTSASLAYLRRIRRRTWTMIAVLVFLLVLLSQFSTSRNYIPSQQRIQQPIPPNTPSVVLVTTLDATSNDELRAMISENRQGYAARHGYAVFLPNVTDYAVHEDNVPTSWSKIPAVRHAMTKYPHTSYFFYLDRTALITNPTLSLHTHITERTRLESLMIPDQPIVPPDSVIRTMHTRKADHVDFIVTQDHEGLSQASFILRRGDWASFFLDSWNDPLYRSYNFQRAEGHALEHLVQWHGTVLARMAIVPQTVMNSYVGSQPQGREQYQDGHFVANIRGCGGGGQAPCEALMKPYYDLYRTTLLVDEATLGAYR